ncbi:MAG: hypothetical protein LBS79_07775 [Tannerella sp.]|nr:hypothetical protein [Tannerella sp.]
MKRIIIISSGDNPSRNNIFVETIVMPQIIIVNKAAKWYIKVFGRFITSQK